MKKNLKFCHIQVVRQAFMVADFPILLSISVSREMLLLMVLYIVIFPIEQLALLQKVMQSIYVTSISYLALHD